MAAAFDGLRRDHELVRDRGRRQPGRDQPPRPRQQPDARPRRRRRAARRRHRSRRRLRPPLRHVGAGARHHPRSASPASCSTSSAATRRCSSPGRASSPSSTGMAHAGVLPMLDHELPDEEGATVRAAPRRRRHRTSPSSATRTPRTSTSSTCSATSPTSASPPARPTSPAPTWSSCPAPSTSPPTSPGCARAASTTPCATPPPTGAACSASAAARCCSADRVVDPDGVEGAADGLGLLPFDTVMHPTKLTRHDHPHLPRPARRRGRRSTA